MGYNEKESASVAGDPLFRQLHPRCSFQLQSATTVGSRSDLAVHSCSHLPYIRKKLIAVSIDMFHLRIN